MTIVDPPLMMAHERRLPVLDPLVPLVPDGGLVRGRLVATSGSAAVSLALALAAAPTRAGSWLGVVGFSDVGLAAAAEAGVALERTVLVSEPSGRGTTWAEVVAILADGFDLVMLPATARLSERDARRVQQRLTSRGGVIIVVGGPGSFVPDLTFDTRCIVWQGLGCDGAGHLTQRMVQVDTGGRRCGAPRRATLVLPDPQGGLAVGDPDAAGVGSADTGSADVAPAVGGWSRAG